MILLIPEAHKIRCAPSKPQDSTLSKFLVRGLCSMPFYLISPLPVARTSFVNQSVLYAFSNSYQSTTLILADTPLEFALVTLHRYYLDSIALIAPWPNQALPHAVPDIRQPPYGLEDPARTASLAHRILEIRVLDPALFAQLLYKLSLGALIPVRLCISKTIAPPVQSSTQHTCHGCMPLIPLCQSLLCQLRMGRKQRRATR